MRRSSQNIGDAGSPDGRQENTISTRMRLAAGLCALSVALLFTGLGGPVATAETDADGSISNTHDHVGAAETGPVEGPVETNVVDTIPELLGALGADPQTPSQDGETHDGGEVPKGPGGLTGPMALGGSTDEQPAAPAVTTDNTGSGSSPAATSQESSQPETVVSHTPDSSSDSQTNVEAASLTNAEVNSLTSGEVNSSTDDQVNPPAGNPPAAEPAVVQPVTNSVESVESPASSAPPPPPAAPPVVGAAAANDVIKALAYFFIALTPDGVPYIKIPNNLLSLLGIPAMAEAATASLTAGGIGGSLLAGGLYTAARIQPASSLSVPTGWPGMLIAPGDSAALASARAAAHPTPEGVGASGAVEQRPVGIKAVLAGGILPEQVRSVLQHTVDAVLAPLSMLALAALASPGVVGLLLLSAAGMFVGYRQAKAASMLRAVGIARFVKAGPLGVVRSGGLVALHARPSTAARPESRRSRGVLETVA
ncbi:MAG: hypothetical protein QOJ24_2841 [Mycobacterium sp.]|jgi:hypothetical protein|nr:hypothetical protein [Mycobacterium sp.]